MPDEWLDSARRGPRGRARTLSYLFFGGALLALGAIAFLPLPPGANIPAALVTIGVALLAGAALFVAAERVPGWAIPAGLALGTAIVSLNIYWAGDVRTENEMFYLWVAFYAFYFFSRRMAALQLALVGAGYGLAIALRHEAAGSTRWAITMGTLTIAGVLTARVVRQLERWVERTRERQAALREAEERFRSAFEDAAVGMAIADLSGHWLRVNEALARMVGYRPEQLIGRRFSEITPEEDVPADEEALEQLVGGRLSVYQREKRYRRADGSIVWALLSVSVIHDDGGRPAHLIAQMQDISDRKAAERELAQRALHDPLTGLPNRVLFLDRVEGALARAARTGLPVAVFFVDLDRFKLVNDSLGHVVGDRMLIDVAERLRSALRPMDTVSRFGGDEFTILCENVDEAAAGVVAQRISTSLSRPFVAEGRELFATASIGVSISRESGASPEAMLRDADAAMYQAKERGRARCVVFDRAMRQRATERLELESDLRKALDRDELRLYYQPVVELADGAISGVEALVRWQHPRRGLLSADTFIPVAEESGLVGELGEWVMLTACRQARAWQLAERELEMSINLSPAQLGEPKLAATIGRIIEQTGARPERICLEITERAAVDSGLAPLEALKAIGVTLAVDDFGAGFSSLNQIRRLPPVHVLKVDRSFTFELGRGRAETAIVTAIVSMARSLELDVIAEGVTRREQVCRLLALGCRRGQGFYFSPPVDAAGIEALLDAPRPQNSPSCPAG